MPSRPEDLLAHNCIGSGPWQLSRGETTVTPDIQSPVILNNPTVLLDLTLRHHGIALLPLYMSRWPETGNNLIPVLPRWNLEPVTLCALFSGQSRLTPKLQVLLDFLGEYIGTPLDPRLRGADHKGMFASPRE